jgi:hypothetical protein
VLIYYHEVTLEEGFEILKKEKKDRLVHGRQVSGCSGWKLFKSLEGQPIKCWECGCVADRWVADKGRNDLVGPPVLNLYGTRDGNVVLMNRDHIIPKSTGGTDFIENLRPACEICNGKRGNQLTPEDLEFRKLNPHLINKNRFEKGKRLARKACHRHQPRKNKELILAPFKALDEM